MSGTRGCLRYGHLMFTGESDSGRLGHRGARGTAPACTATVQPKFGCRCQDVKLPASQSG